MAKEATDAAALTRYRRAAGVSQQRLAEHLEITREAIGQIENGRITVAQDFAHRWYEAIDIIERENGTQSG